MAGAMLFDQVAFCCISTGLFGYPAAEAADVALTSVQRRTGFAAASFLSGVRASLVLLVHFVPRKRRKRGILKTKCWLNSLRRCKDITHQTCGEKGKVGEM